MLELNILPDCYDQSLARNEDIRLTGSTHAGSAALDRADHLRGDIDTAQMVVFIHIDAGRGHQGFYFDAFGNSTLNLARQCGHIGYTAAVENGNLFCAETSGSADRIHGHVSAANDSNLLTGQVRI